MSTYLSPAQVAQIMGVSRDTVYSMIHRNQLDSYLFGRSRRITQEQIDDVLEGIVHTHVQLHHIGSGHDEEEARSGVRRCGHINPDAIMG